MIVTIAVVVSYCIFARVLLAFGPGEVGRQVRTLPQLGDNSLSVGSLDLTIFPVCQC